MSLTEQPLGTIEELVREDSRVLYWQGAPEDPGRLSFPLVR